MLTATELPVPWIDVPPPARIAGDDRPPAAAVEDPGPGPHDVRPATSAAVPAAPVEPASPAPAAVEATATITTPVDGVATPRSVTVSGTAALPAGRRLWLLVRAPDGAHHTTTQRPIRIALTGEWTVPVTLGRGPQDVGRSYGLVLVVAPDGGAVQTAVDGRPEGRSSARLLAVPDDTVVMQRILVTSTT